VSQVRNSYSRIVKGVQLQHARCGLDGILKTRHVACFRSFPNRKGRRGNCDSVPITHFRSYVFSTIADEFGQTNLSLCHSLPRPWLYAWTWICYLLLRYGIFGSICNSRDLTCFNRVFAFTLCSIQHCAWGRNCSANC
jgi:hypothetical protein